MSSSGGNTSKRLDYLATRKLSTDSFAMLVPLTQPLRVIKVYFPLALPGPKGINVEFRAQRSEVRSQKSEIKRQRTKRTGHRAWSIG